MVAAYHNLPEHINIRSSLLWYRYSPVPALGLFTRWPSPNSGLRERVYPVGFVNPLFGEMKGFSRNSGERFMFIERILKKERKPTECRSFVGDFFSLF